jgi:hypothetical protein
MSFILKGSQISAFQLKGWFKSKMSIQENRNEIQNSYWICAWIIWYMFPLQCEESRINHLTPLLVLTTPHTCWFLWWVDCIEDFKWRLHFQFGVAFWRVVLREVYFEGPNRIWRALKTWTLPRRILGIRATSHTRLRAHDRYTSSTLIGGKGKAGPSVLHTTPKGPMEYSIKRTWTGSAFSTNESAWSLMATGSEPHVWSGPKGYFTLWPKVERPSISTNQIARNQEFGLSTLPTKAKVQRPSQFKTLTVWQRRRTLEGSLSRTGMETQTMVKRPSVSFHIKTNDWQDLGC